MSIRLRGALLAAALLFALPATAQTYTLGELRIETPWTRATAATGASGGGYLVIRNTGSRPDRLIRAETAAARVTELHTMTMENNVMRMRPVADIAVPAGGEVRLAPGGLHVMFIDTTQRFEPRQTIPVRLVFETAGTIEVAFTVEAAGARAPGQGHRH